jgi:predicted SprT family Zn-dependent metalloprotease
MKKFNTREEWLEAAVEIFRPRFEATLCIFKLPPKVRVSVGFPPKGAMSRNRKCLGVCTRRNATVDHIPQIYLNPVIEETGGERGYLSVLIHELIHACGIENHGKDFKLMGESLGLEGKMRSSYASQWLQEDFKYIAEQLGDFPHVPVIPVLQLSKPDKCRIHKCACPECGYTVRVSKKWIDVALPECPVCRVELIKEEER